MKFYLISFFLLLITLGGFAQSTGTVAISGTVLDSLSKDPIPQAGIRILAAKDSSYVNGAATNLSGRFNASVKPGNYIIDISFLGYTNQYLNIQATKPQNQLGNIYLKEDGILLQETTVIGKAPDIIVKGDTVEYNADAYKVQESAVLEDLIKKIPGAEVDSEGKIKVNGKDISKILVDGKEFFSDDPQTASKNLPAKIVDKLQVLDKKSDMAQITGFDDGEEETVINLVVKPGMKQGLYGNALIGYGSEDRYEGNGFLNYAKDNTRISVLGNFNNNNNQNANSRSGGRGITETKEGGANFAIEPSKKLKWDGDIYYSQTDRETISESNKSYINVDKTESSRSRSNVISDRFNIRQKLEWEPDTMTKVIFRPNLNYSKTENRSRNTSNRIDNDSIELSYEGLEENSTNSKNLNLSGNLLINRKLNNKGRSVTLEVSGGYSTGDDDGLEYNEIDYYETSNPLKITNRKSNTDNDSYNWRARLSYLEPVGYNNFLEFAYNIRQNISKTDKKTFDYDDFTGDYTEVANDFTRNIKNEFLNQNISLNFQSRKQKYNYTLGLGVEPSKSKTTINHPDQEKKETNRNTVNFSPRVEFNYLWDKRHNLRVRYNARTSEASTTQLFDGIISQNGTDKTIGNPNLKPKFTNNLFVRYQKYIPERASSIMAFARFTHTSNDIVTINKWNNDGGRTNTYENINGNMNGNFRLMYNTPLKNKKFSINTATYGSYNRDNKFIQQRDSSIQKNTANVFNIGEDLRLKFNSDVFQFDLGGRVSFESTRNSINSNQNQEVYNFGGFGNFSWYLPYDFVIESDINYSSNSGYSSGYQLNEWLWNASVSKQFLKGKNATIRFKIYDILKERTNISRSSTAEAITESVTNSLNSYFMVNFIYRFQSFKGSSRSNNSDGEERQGPGRFGREGRGGSGRPPGGMF
ncbi:TonB-dependent receptor [Dysgonomonas sp. 216]|uniref:TonB-dependent receptor n=1 Tax=Dysgonomonas sp. 216 TaxID=2302934 RepID=UPI0013D69340|nr:TonB-dependent receptor [Dysgonomonas sp. 216]NDW17901.1 TonB-dependent receptor [Dysgonomonas sp. 216]